MTATSTPAPSPREQAAAVLTALADAARFDDVWPDGVTVAEAATALHTLFQQPVDNTQHDTERDTYRALQELTMAWAVADKAQGVAPMYPFAWAMGPQVVNGAEDHANSEREKRTPHGDMAAPSAINSGRAHRLAQWATGSRAGRASAQPNTATAAVSSGPVEDLLATSLIAPGHAPQRMLLTAVAAADPHTLAHTGDQSTAIVLISRQGKLLLIVPQPVSDDLTHLLLHQGGRDRAAGAGEQ